MSDISKNFFHIARLALQGRKNDVAMFVKKEAPKIIKDRIDLKNIAEDVISMANNISLLRGMDVNNPIPVDIETRLSLLKKENISSFDKEPVWMGDVKANLEYVIKEREHEKLLDSHGVQPSRTLLFDGCPGVGKTLAAKWLAYKLKRPLLTLDLAAVMSSYLGKTGNNIRAVLEYAKKLPSILLLDEFDSIAKRRDDEGEIGELKRLVNVLLQEIDNWPSEGILIAATNHPELLDPAVWRRFDRIVSFPRPTENYIKIFLENLLKMKKEKIDIYLLSIASITFQGLSFAEIERCINNIMKASLLDNKNFEDTLLLSISSYIKDLPRAEKFMVVDRLKKAGVSQRQINKFTGISRDTIRKKVGGN